MGNYIFRPTGAALTGSTSVQGNPSTSSIIGDNSDSTWIALGSNYQGVGTAITTFGPFTDALLPANRKVLAVRVAGRVGNDSSRRGVPEFWLRQNNARIANSRLYTPDGYQNGVFRNQYGPWIYKTGNVPWSAAEVDAMSTEIRFVDTNQSWPNSVASETWIDVLYDEPLIAPTNVFPAGGATVDTSKVPFSAQAPAPQAGQLVRGVWQVARDTGFTSGVQTFYGSFHDRTGATERATIDPATVDLGPGVWYMRVLVQDVTGTVTAWTTTSSFTIAHAALPQPINTSPAPGSIKVDPYGIRSARVDTAASDDRTVGVEWQYSKSSTFASGIVTWKNTTDRVTTGTVSYNAEPKNGVSPMLWGYDVSPDDVSQYLTQGVWYVRSRTVDKWGQVSAWSSTNDTFTVQHAPLAQNVSPTSNAVIDQAVTPVRWTFGDPWNKDSQTAYQIRVYNDANTLIYDSTKLSSTALQHFLAINSSYLYSALKYTINLYDKDGVTPVSVATNNFIFSNSPAIVQSYPAQNETVLTGQPTFSWNPGIGRPGTTQRSFELNVYRQDNNALVYTSGVVVSSTARTHTPPQVILRNGVAYRETLRIVDSDNLSSTLNRNFTASYQAPPEPTVTVNPTSYSQNGYALIDWSGTVPDDYFVAWKIYRKRKDAVDWDLIYVEDDSAVASYRDWLVPSVGEYQWSVTQLADRSGFILESGIDDNAPSNYIVSEDYWLIVEDDDTRNVRLYSVSDDKFTDEIERNEYVVKGRGRRVNYGTVIGMNGSLSVKLRYNSGISARDQRRVLKELSLECISCLLRDPFGNITRVSLGDISTSRMAGVGNQEFADLEIPYMEVF